MSFILFWVAIGIQYQLFGLLKLLVYNISCLVIGSYGHTMSDVWSIQFFLHSFVLATTFLFLYRVIPYITH